MSPVKEHDLSSIYEYTNTAMGLIGKTKLAIGCYRLRFNQAHIAVYTSTVYKGRNTRTVPSCFKFEKKL